MDLQAELTKQYTHLRNRVFKAAYSHYFSTQDAEDLFHDVCLNILEEQINPGEWGRVITCQLGKARTNRTRKQERETTLDQTAH